MLTIGILGDENMVAFKVMREMFKENKIDFSAFCLKNSEDARRAYMEAVLKKAKVFIVQLGNYTEKNESFDVLRFDILLFLLKGKKDEIFLDTFLKSRNFLILDSDLELPKTISTGGETIVITCGFNHTASVTVSSVGLGFSGELQGCVQRMLLRADGSFVLPQEFLYKKDYKEKDIPKVLAAVAAAVISGATV